MHPADLSIALLLGLLVTWHSMHVTPLALLCYQSVKAYVKLEMLWVTMCCLKRCHQSMMSL